MMFKKGDKVVINTSESELFGANLANKIIGQVSVDEYKNGMVGEILRPLHDDTYVVDFGKSVKGFGIVIDSSELIDFKKAGHALLVDESMIKPYKEECDGNCENCVEAAQPLSYADIRELAEKVVGIKPEEIGEVSKPESIDEELIMAFNVLKKGDKLSIELITNDGADEITMDYDEALTVGFSEKLEQFKLMFTLIKMIEGANKEND